MRHLLTWSLSVAVLGLVNGSARAQAPPPPAPLPSTVGALGLFLPGGASLANTNTGDPTTATNTLYFDTGDFEATFTTGASNWKMVASAGVRYLHFNQTYSLFVADAVNGPSTVYSF